MADVAAVALSSGMTSTALMLLAAFVLILAIAWGASRREQDASQQWPEAAGTVVTVEAEPAVGRGAGRREQVEAWQPKVVYRYEVDGRPYTSGRLEFDPAHARMSRSEVDDLLRGYRPGMAVRVRYDPARPERAVLVSDRG